MKVTNVQTMKDQYFNNFSMGKAVGVCVDDLIFSAAKEGTVLKIEVKIEHDLPSGPDWFIKATAEVEEKE